MLLATHPPHGVTPWSPNPWFDVVGFIWSIPVCLVLGNVLGWDVGCVQGLCEMIPGCCWLPIIPIPGVAQLHFYGASSSSSWLGLGVLGWDVGGPRVHPGIRDSGIADCPSSLEALGDTTVPKPQLDF